MGSRPAISQLNDSSSTKSTSGKNNSDNPLENLEFLKDLDGKSLYEAKLLDNPVFKKRLTNLVGNRYEFIKKLEVETPITVTNNIFITKRCRAHNCANTNVITVVDLSKNTMYVGIREETNVKTYSDDGGSSQEIIDWAKKI
jgi:hypothetical protein